VAIKIIDKIKITSKSDRKRLNRELKILKASNHSCIIKLYEILESTASIYIVTEYAASGELFSLIVNSKKLSEREAAILFKQIVLGMEYIHSLGFVHRDLKPENILLDHQNEIKIADFGLCNSYSHNELLKTSCGSPCYASPEMISGKPYKAESVDIWSLGVVLYTMLSGCLPFEVQI
jgi:5'-AMP-activated protein kinase catalytic alpha subunit